MMAGQQFCGEDWSKLKKKYHSLEEEDLLRYCFSSAYIVALLHDSLGVSLDDERYIPCSTTLPDYVLLNSTLLILTLIVSVHKLAPWCHLLVIRLQSSSLGDLADHMTCGPPLWAHSNELPSHWQCCPMVHLELAHSHSSRINSCPTWFYSCYSKYVTGLSFSLFLLKKKKVL